MNPSFLLAAGGFTLLAAVLLAYAWWEHKRAWKRFELALDRSIGPLSQEISGISEDLNGASSNLATLAKDFSGVIGSMDSVSSAFHLPEPGPMVPPAGERSVSLGRVDLGGLKIEDLKGSREEVTRFLRDVQGTLAPEYLMKQLMKQLQEIQDRERRSVETQWQISNADIYTQLESTMKPDVQVQDAYLRESIVIGRLPEYGSGQLKAVVRKEKPALH